MSFFIIPQLTILLLRFLAVYHLLPHYLPIMQNLILEPEYVFFLAIAIVSKATNYMTLRISKYLYLGMLSFMKNSIPFIQLSLNTLGRSLSSSCFVYTSWWYSCQPIHHPCYWCSSSPPNLSFLFVNLLELLNLLLMISIAIIPIMSLFLLVLIPISHIVYPNTYHIIPYAHLTSTLSWQFRLIMNLNPSSCSNAAVEGCYANRIGGYKNR